MSKHALKLDWRLEWPQWVLILWVLGSSAWGWIVLPDRLPVHFDFSGNPDRWGGKVEALLIMPAIVVGMYFFLLVLPRFDPGKANYPHFAGSYATIRLAAITVLAVVHTAMLVSYREHRMESSSLWLYLLGGILVVLGNVMGKIRPNWFVGIRTPWTLSSKRSWSKTHRLGGWVLIVGGVACLVAALIGHQWATASALAVLIAGLAATVVYSYLVWRDDPDKTPPANTAPAEE